MSTQRIRFDGLTYDPERDGRRLARQTQDVFESMRDGQWRTLAEIRTITGHPEASISARLRDLRKNRFGAHTVKRRYMHEGLYMYQLVINADVIFKPEEMAIEIGTNQGSLF